MARKKRDPNQPKPVKPSANEQIAAFSAMGGMVKERAHVIATMLADSQGALDQAKDLRKRARKALRQMSKAVNTLNSGV